MRLETGRASATAFVAAFAALFLQVLVHRIISAKLLSNYAFLVISVSMLGFAAAGAVLSFTQRAVLDHRRSSLTLVSALFSLSALAAAIAFYATSTPAPFAVTRSGFVTAFFGWIPFALFFAVPFACVAFILGALLAASDLDARRIYFFDLVGSALGAVLVLLAIREAGVETSLLLLSALVPLATSWLLSPRSGWARAAVWVAVAATIGVAAFRSSLFDLQPAAGTPVAEARKLGGAGVTDYIRWDPLSRVELSRIGPPDPASAAYAALIGEDRAFLSRFERMVTQNNYAYAYAVRYDGQPESLAGVRQTLYAAGYEMHDRPPARVVVIGVGGGFDILTALHYGASEVTGVEVNGTVLRLLTRDYRDYFRPWLEAPGVRLVADEGRHFLARAGGLFDLVQVSGVDTYSGTPAAAHVFSENYVYTREAFALYLSRLTPDGCLHMMRLEHTPPREMLRALVTAVAALRQAGIARPSEHVVMLAATRGNIASLLVKKTPFAAEEVRRLESWSAGRSFAVAAAPGRNARSENAYQAFLHQESEARERAFVAAYPFDISPTEDDRPFFFRFSRWGHVFTSDPLVQVTVPVMEYSLLLLLAAVCVAALLVVWLPLRSLGRPGRPRGFSRFLLFFTAIGIAFMAVEIAFLQRFGLVLGHPNYALSVVLAVLLLSSGIGSWWARPILTRLGGPRFVAYALSGVVLAQVLLLPEPEVCVTWPLALRVALVTALVGGTGVLMGTFLPTGLERLKAAAPSFAPWAWGVNGIASVIAPVISVGLGITYGNRLLLVAALPLYLVAGACLPPSSEETTGASA